MHQSAAMSQHDVTIRARDLRVGATVAGRGLRRKLIAWWCVMGGVVGLSIHIFGQGAQLTIVTGMVAPVVCLLIALRMTRGRRASGTFSQAAQVRLDPHGLHVGLTSAPWSAVRAPELHGGTVVVRVGSHAFAWLASDDQQPLLDAIVARAGSRSGLQDPSAERVTLSIPVLPTWPAIPQAMGLILVMGLIISALRWMPTLHIGSALALLILPATALATAWWWMPRLRGGGRASAGPDGWVVHTGALVSTGTWIDAPLGRVGRAVELGVAVIPLRTVGPDRLAQLHAWSANAQAPWDDLGELD